MTPDRIIGIMGKKRAGKDVIAARLVEAHGFTRLAFADPMRAALLALDPIIPFVTAPSAPFPPLRLGVYVTCVGWEAAKEHVEVRRLLQQYGTGIRDYAGRDVWVDAMERNLHNTLGPVVISDVRFPNEAARISRLGGVLARVYRPDLVSTDTHISELALDDLQPDYGIVNDGTLDDLHRYADTLAACTL